MKTFPVAVLLTLLAVSNGAEPLSEWEIRTGTSLAAQKARGERQAAQFAAKDAAAKKQAQAQADARDPAGANVRRAQEAYYAAKTPEERAAAFELWEKFVQQRADAEERSRQERATAAQADDLARIRALLELQQLQRK